MKQSLDTLDENLHKFKEKVKFYFQIYLAIVEDDSELTNSFIHAFEKFQGKAIHTGPHNPFDSNSLNDSLFIIESIREDKEQLAGRWMMMQYHSIAIHIYEIFESHLKYLCKVVSGDNYKGKDRLKDLMNYLNNKLDPELNKHYLLLNSYSRLHYHRILFYEKLRHKMVHAGGYVNLIDFTKHILKDLGAELLKDEQISLDNKTINPELLAIYQQKAQDFELSDLIRKKIFSSWKELLIDKDYIKWSILTFSNMFINSTGFIENKTVRLHINEKTVFQSLFESVIEYMNIQTRAVKELNSLSN